MLVTVSAAHMSDHRRPHTAKIVIPHCPSGEIVANNEYANGIIRYDFGSNMMSDRSESMFDHFLIYGFRNARDKAPSVLYHFPTGENTMIKQKYDISLDTLGSFCFPRHVLEDDSDEAYQSVLDDSISAARKVMDSTFIFTLNVTCPEDEIPVEYRDKEKHENLPPPTIVKYGFCVMTKEPEGMCPSVSQEWRTSRRVGADDLVSGRVNLTRRCYCIISSNPAFAVLYQFMDAFITRERLAIKYSAGLVAKDIVSPRDETIKMMEEFYNHHVPKPNKGKCFLLKCDPRKEWFSFSKTTKDGLVAEWCFPPTFKIVNTKSLMKMLGYLMMDAPLIVSTLSSGVASAVIFTFLVLLRPLAWCGTVSTVMPSTQSGAMYMAPVPFISYSHKSIPDLVGKVRSDAILLNLDSTPIRCRIPKQTYGFEFDMPYTKKLMAVLSSMQTQFKEHLYIKEVTAVMDSFRRFQCKLLYKILRGITPLQLDTYLNATKDLANIWYNSKPKRSNKDKKLLFIKRYVVSQTFTTFLMEFGAVLLRIMYHSNMKDLKSFEDCFKPMKKKLFPKL